jgi:hypothetical protein
MADSNPKTHTIMHKFPNQILIMLISNNQMFISTKICKDGRPLVLKTM